jgi:hypothetical protein
MVLYLAHIARRGLAITTMKAPISQAKINRSALCLILLILASRCLAGTNIDVIVVAEQSSQGAKLAPPTPESPVSFVTCSGDYIEAGPALGGLKPPAPESVGQQLQQVLQSRNYQPTQAQPSLLLTYQWGIIRNERGTMGGLFAYNFESRLSLVTTDEQFHTTEERLETHNHVRVLSEKDILESLVSADASRYFVVISAYDFADLSHGVVTLLWRVKVSARENSGWMDEVLPALLDSCGPYLGRNLNKAQNLSVPLPPPLPRANPAEHSLTAAQEITCSGPIRTLMQREHAFYSGEPYNSGAKRPLGLPPTITEHIAAYQQGKAAFEALLTDWINARPAGQDIRSAINAFKEANAPRIAALAKQREELRDELARFCATKSPGITEETLDFLLKEFASEKLHLAPSSTTPN